MMSPAELAKVRTNAANSALRTAAKHGATTICQTKIGNVDLRRTETGFELVTEAVYNPRTNNADPGKVLASGPKAAVRKALEPLFVIAFEG